MKPVRKLYGAICFLSLIFWPGVFAGCAGMNSDKAADGVKFSKIGEFRDSSGQARILLIVYSGEATKGNIKQYAENLGCGMVFAYYYPETTDINTIPVGQLESAGNFVEAREALFTGENSAKWRFASQCLGMVPTLTDCMEFTISTNCR